MSDLICQVAHFAYLQQQAVFDSYHKKGDSKNDFRDSEFYMSHYQKDAHTEKGYVQRLRGDQNID